MMKISRWLTVAGLAGTLLTGAAFAQTASSGHMKPMKHGSMSTGAMSAHSSGHTSSGARMSHGHMSSGAMTSGDHMKAKHAGMDRHAGKRRGHVAAAGTSSGH